MITALADSQPGQHWHAGIVVLVQFSHTASEASDALCTPQPTLWRKSGWVLQEAAFEEVMDAWIEPGRGFEARSQATEVHQIRQRAIVTDSQPTHHAGTRLDKVQEMPNDMHVDTVIASGVGLLEGGGGQGMATSTPASAFSVPFCLRRNPWISPLRSGSPGPSPKISRTPEGAPKLAV